MATVAKASLQVDEKELKRRFEYKEDGLYFRVPTKKSSVGARFGSIQGRAVGSKYRRGKFSGTNYLEHRLIWVYFHGEIPDGHVVDHINHDGLDNRLENLRLVTQSQNAKNMPKYSSNRSGLPGVHFSQTKRVWVAQTNIAGKRVCLGWFDNIFDAACARLSSLVYLNYHPNHCQGG